MRRMDLNWKSPHFPRERASMKLWDPGLVDVCTIGAAGINSCSVYDAVYLFSHEDSAAGQNCYVRKDSAIAKETGYLEDYPDVLGSPETIKGATILLPMGTGNQAEIDTYLELLGLTEEDVSLVNMDTAPAYQAFVSVKAICV